MRLLDRETGKEIAPGDQVELRNRTYHYSGHDPKGQIIFLFPAEGDGSPFPVKPGAIGAKLAA